MKRPVKSIAVLTSGGDAPGMNIAIRSVVKVARTHGVDVTGVRGGYRGLIAGDFTPLDAEKVSDIITRGGTMLGSSREPRFLEDAGKRDGIANLERAGIDGLIVIGGNGSQSGAKSLHELGFPTIGVASTIDNDLHTFEMSIGVDTALNTALEMLDRLQDTASSHNRAFVVELMGRNSGYLAMMAGIASGANLVLTPEFPVTQDEVVEACRTAPRDHSSPHFIIIVAEGSPLKAAQVVDGIQDVDGPFSGARLTVLGHVQRGGTPLVFDRTLAARSAELAVRALLEGKSGYVAGLSGGEYNLVPHEVAIQPDVKVTESLVRLSRVLGA
ncbi:MAG: ATP-dependent 6-phosphofructokinase [Thermomicrobiales bacterium]|nr:ATP-dependent 6-phosphofructokinase [Thermomicrobiales bacterium]